jgi:TolA-binding protein
MRILIRILIGVLVLASIAAIASAAAADDPGTSLAGSSGWAGAGLLGLVLFWLAYSHLPGKDAQLEKILSDHRSEIKTLVDTHNTLSERIQEKHDAIMTQQRQDHAAMMKAQQEACARELKAISETFGATLTSEIRDEIGQLSGSVKTFTEAMHGFFMEAARRADRSAEDKRS